MPSGQDPDTWMWERARELLEQADRIHRGPYSLTQTGEPRPTWEPPVDVFETGTELWILVALPGVDPASVEVLFDGDRLTVSGCTQLPEGCRRAGVVRVEIPHGRFQRQIELPCRCAELVRQEPWHGCLFLGLRKRS